MTDQEKTETEESSPAETMNKWQKMATEAAKEESAAEDKATQDWDALLADMTPEEKVETLTARLIDLQEMTDKAEDRTVRTMAEMENLRRRTDRDIENARKYAAERLLKELLPVIDSMDRGLQAMSADDSALTGARDGLNMTRDMMLKVLSAHGVDIIAPEAGEAFNPSLHEAVSMQAQEGLPSKVVVNAFQPGYQLNGRVVRAAMVVVTP